MTTLSTSMTQFSPVLTQQFLDDHLTEWFHRSITFTRWQYVGETGKGDSFLSDLVRVKLFGKDSDDTERDVQVVLKTIPKSKCRRLTYRLDEFFKNEITFYQKILPELLKFQERKNPISTFDQYTKYVAGHIDGVNDVLVLEDVSLQSYGSPTRQEGIDYEHCEVVLNTFAKFHALSFAMKDQEPQNFERIANYTLETYYRPDLWDWYEKFWDRLSKIAIDAVEKEYPDSIYLEKVKEFASPKTYPRMCEAVTDRKNGVISHGDSWTNNFLFKYGNSTKPLDAKMIDLQLTRCASPVLDVAFFIYACTTQDMREKYYEKMLKFYHDTLTEQIASLGSDPNIYSWDDFMSDVKKYSFFGLAFSFESTPFIVLEPEDAPDMTMEGEDKMNINDIWSIELMKTKSARLREANNVVHCVDHGYI